MWMFDEFKMFKDLNTIEKSQLEMFCQEKSVKAWEEIFKEWDEANAMYILKEWEIEVYKSISWNNTTIWLIESEDVLWEMAIFGLSWKRMASAVVKKDAKLITILSFSIKELTTKNPSILNKIQIIIETRNIQNKKALK
jgi:CRP/FNR family cyclic AMP-dependent transcriptional regulator